MVTLMLSSIPHSTPRRGPTPPPSLLLELFSDRALLTVGCAAVQRETQVMLPSSLQPVGSCLFYIATHALSRLLQLLLQ